MTGKLRVGAVSYMNTKPLVWGLESYKDIADFYFDVPSKLYQVFSQGDLDIALLPAVCYFEKNSYRIIPNISISTYGRVESVNLYLKKDIKDVKVVALDTSSRTSRILTAIILRKQYGLNPDFINWDKGLSIDESQADAVLLIGDNAMKIHDSKYRILDLGNEWQDLTGLPFVFAVWVTKCDTILNGFDKILQKAKDEGIKAIEKIAESEAKRLGFTKEICSNYLRNAIRYDLGEEELQGVRKFYEYGVELGLIKKAKDEGEKLIRFYK